VSEPVEAEMFVLTGDAMNDVLLTQSAAANLVVAR
jgi:hypothetical protein